MKNSRKKIMAIDYKIDEYRKWLGENVSLSDPFSQKALRRLTFHLLIGGNFRLLTEPNIKGQLFTTFLWLADIQKELIKEHNTEWLHVLFEDIYSKKKKPKELQNLLYWIMGLTHKTAINLGLKQEDYPRIFEETIDYFNELFSKINRHDFKDNAWLLLMAGSATLNIRGSKKSKIGKQFEKVFLRGLLSILGLKENENFWMNIGRDLEVEREADAKVLSKRGKIRIEAALISGGNQEVIEDKISRVGRNGIVLFDVLGKKTRVYQIAENNGVKLVQLRNCNPLLDIYRHLKHLVPTELKTPPETLIEIKKAVNSLPVSIFTIE